MFLIATLHFLGPIKNVQENFAEVKITTEKTGKTGQTGQDVAQMKDGVAQIKG